MKYVIYETYDGYAVTILKNYTSYVQNAREVMHFKNNPADPWTYADVLDYCCKYCNMTPDNFVPCPY